MLIYYFLYIYIIEASQYSITLTIRIHQCYTTHTQIYMRIFNKFYTSAVLPKHLL